ncbi:MULTISPECIES: ribonuclease Z [unclassified Arcicella]|uniref:ribonuclease Z n=1 Tax=unclassified Arcicella TaxID=2644986 RepID=UPI0028593AE7|nr:MULTISPECIES: ribonuclease Z [unclassified Arcicella]MDR6562576.1 ribonuclease Z [Arcicella sp. BE51]MDR6812663.1 ribonuclease Z [Arcicella sp. BE140]MDR6823975.1 ribonuclease Z [Arcicella sp. BE139]
MSFQLTILGTGSATPVLTRNPTAHHLQIEQDGYLIDCGEGTQNQLLHYKIRTTKLKYIFITHLHGDHFFGLIGLLSTLNMHRRIEDLWIFAPKGLAEIITIQLKYSDTRLNFKIHFTETQTEKSYLLFTNEHVKITTIPLIHRVPCCGFLFQERRKKRKIIKTSRPTDLTFEQIKRLKDGEDILNDDGSIKYKNEDYTIPSLKSGSYAFCSDTLYNEAIIDIIKNVDLLYHEATFLDELLPRAIQTNHSTTKQAALIAKKAHVGKLIIGHYSSRYKELDTHLAEAREVFVNTYLAIEGETHKIRDIKL